MKDKICPASGTCDRKECQHLVPHEAEALCGHTDCGLLHITVGSCVDHVDKVPSPLGVHARWGLVHGFDEWQIKNQLGTTSGKLIIFLDENGLLNREACQRFLEKKVKEDNNIKTGLEKMVKAGLVTIARAEISALKKAGYISPYGAAALEEILSRYEKGAK